MRKLFVFCLLIIISLEISAQNSWIKLKYPMAGILGRSVQHINKGDIIWEPTSVTKGMTFITNESADEIDDYTDRFRSFVLKFINSSKTKINKVSVRKLVVKSLDPESIDKLTIGRSYVYEGLSADTVVVELSTQRDLNVDLNQFAKSILNALDESNSEELKRIIPILDSASLARTDSFSYRMLIVNPNVFFKVKVIYLHKRETDDLSYDVRFQYFPFKREDKESTILKVDATGILSETDAISPYYYSYQKKEGAIHIKNVKIKLALRKVGMELKLFALVQPADLDASWIEILEIPYIVEDGLKVWRLDRKRVYTFPYKHTFKSLYLKVTAKQVNENSIEIINWQGKEGNLNYAYTYIQYPDVSFIYRKK